MLNVDGEAGDDAAEKATFAVKTHLTEEIDGDRIDDEDATDIAEDLVGTFEERVDRSYPGWETNHATEQEIERLVLDTLALEHDRADLINDPFVDAVRGYLIENYV